MAALGRVRSNRTSRTQGYDGLVKQACFTSIDRRRGTQHAAPNLSWLCLLCHAWSKAERQSSPHSARGMAIAHGGAAVGPAGLAEVPVYIYIYIYHWTYKALL